MHDSRTVKRVNSSPLITATKVQSAGCCDVTEPFRFYYLLVFVAIKSYTLYMSSYSLLSYFITSFSFEQSY